MSEVYTPGAEGENPIASTNPSPGFRTTGSGGTPLAPNGAVGLDRLEISRSASPVFFTSMAVDELPLGKLMITPLKSRLGTGAAVPTPRRLTTTLGLAVSLLSIVKLPVKTCAAVGENLTVKSKLAAGAMVSGVAGLLSIEKGEAGLLIAEMIRLLPPVFEIVNVLVKVVRTLPKSRGFGATLMIGAGG